MAHAQETKDWFDDITDFIDMLIERELYRNNKMIIKEVKGNAVNMYLNGEGHLIHGCNCYCNMGAGIAREIRDRIPGAFQVDANTLKGSRDKLGTCSVYIGEKATLFSMHILNMISGHLGRVSIMTQSAMLLNRR